MISGLPAPQWGVLETPGFMQTGHPRTTNFPADQLSPSTVHGAVAGMGRDPPGNHQSPLRPTKCSQRPRSVVPESFAGLRPAW